MLRVSHQRFSKQVKFIEQGKNEMKIYWMRLTAEQTLEKRGELEDGAIMHILNEMWREEKLEKHEWSISEP